MVFLTGYAVACVAWLTFGELSGAFTPQRLVRSVPGDFITSAMLIVLAAFMARLMSENLFFKNRELQRELGKRKRAEEAEGEQRVLAQALNDTVIALGSA